MPRDYTRAENLDIIESEARERNIPRDDFLRFAYIETGGKFDELASRGPRGAKGLFQFVPDTAAEYGIAGRELDPVANTDAAARLYLNNQRSLVARHERDGRPYLSGGERPDGLDMYMAHQQGAGGYRSIQNAIATGDFSRSDTRSNILNNVSPRDLQAITGVSMRDFRAMSDKDLAETFVRYWDTKFDRIQIPEKNIQPIVDGQTQQRPPSQEPGGQTQTRTPGDGQTTTQPGATQQTQAQTQTGQGVTLNVAYDMGVEYDRVRYGINRRSSPNYHPSGKNLEDGRIDCSGWTSRVTNASMDEINREAGREIFTSRDKLSPLGENANAQINRSARESGVLLRGDQVNAENLKEGMLIGIDSARDGKTNYDHIVVVVRDPNTGQLLASESTSRRDGPNNENGVHVQPLEDYLRYANSRGWDLAASDPLHKGRALLENRQQSAQVDDGVLSHGERNTEVKALQEKLKTLGITGNDGTSLTGTGFYGDRTREAVANFQRQNGIDPSGAADRATIDAIDRRLQERQQQPGTSTPGQNALISDSSHPNNALYEAFKSRPELAGAKPEVIANVTLQAMENGITNPGRIGRVEVAGTNVLVKGSNYQTDPGDRAMVDSGAPTASMQSMSDHMRDQTVERQAREEADRVRSQQNPGQTMVA